MLVGLEFWLVGFVLVGFFFFCLGEEMSTSFFRLEKWCPSGLNHHVIFSRIFPNSDKIINSIIMP